MTKTKWYQKPIYLMVALALVFSLGAVAVLMVGTVEAATLYEYYNTGDTGGLYAAYGSCWAAQTFTAESDHTVTSVKLKVYGFPSVGEVTVSIRNTDGAGHPTGSDLTSGTTDGDTLTTNTDGEWREISVTPYSLTSGTKYAIVVRAPDATGSGYSGLYWRFDTSPSYAGGRWERSLDSGNEGTWTVPFDADLMFEVWSEPPTGVGGTAYPPNKLAILAPWMALAAAIVVGIAILARRRRAHS